MKKQKETLKSLEIPVNFHNYKLLKDKSFVLKGSHIYFVQGPNKTGKTSFLKALTSLQVASDDTPEKVSKGESEGYYEAQIPASDGTIITIRHEFTDNNKGKFIAIKPDGTKVNSVTEIRALFNYTPINVSEFFSMSNTAEGRRKQRSIILKLLNEKDQDKFSETDLQETHYYEKRTEVNREHEQVKNSLEMIKVDDADIELLSRKEEAHNLFDKYQKAEFSFRELESIRTEKAYNEEKIKEFTSKLKEQEEKEKEILNSMGNLVDLSPTEIKEKVAKGKTVIEKISKTETILSMREKQENTLENLERVIENLSIDINKCREDKQKIVADSDLPVKNISFEDGYLTIDDFQFKENQICESDAVLLLANILAKINPGPIQVIGDASILDGTRLEKLNKIAEENNKIMFVDEVIRDANDLVVVGYEDISDKRLKESLNKIDKKISSSKTLEIESLKKEENKDEDSINDDSSEPQKNDELF